MAAQTNRLDHEVTETMTVPTGRGARPTVAFVGAGRAGGALATALHDAGYAITAVHSRTPEHAAALAGRVGATVVPTAVAAMRAADLTFITVPDSQVTRIAATVAATGMALPGRGAVHCSASLGLEATAALRITTAGVGAFHPLQALTGAASAPLLRGSGAAIEADPSVRPRLERIAQDLGMTPLPLPAGARRLYHAAAVLTGNAPLALLATAADLLAAAGMERSTAERALASLMAGAAANAARDGARAALTGPVVRGDSATVAGHLAALRGHPEAEALYRSLTAETLRLAGRDGRDAIGALLTPAPERAPAPRRRSHRSTAA